MPPGDREHTQHRARATRLRNSCKEELSSILIELFSEPKERESFRVNYLRCTALRGYRGRRDVQDYVGKECEQMFSLILRQLRPILTNLVIKVAIVEILSLV
jgi:hypothetical protein